MSELKTIEEKVIALLKKYPALRSSDKMLIAAYYNTYHKILTFKEFAYSGKIVPQAESIRRVRQLLQAAGLFLATEETRAHREELKQRYIECSRSNPTQEKHLE